MNRRIDEVVDFRRLMVLLQFTHGIVSWKCFIQRDQGYQRFEGHIVSFI